MASQNQLLIIFYISLKIFGVIISAYCIATLIAISTAIIFSEFSILEKSEAALLGIMLSYVSFPLTIIWGFTIPSAKELWLKLLTLSFIISIPFLMKLSIG